MTEAPRFRILPNMWTSPFPDRAENAPAARSVRPGRRRRWLAALSLLALPALATAITPSPPLRIGAEEWPPYEFLQDGSPTGINVEVYSRIFSRLNLPHEIRFYPFARSLMLVEKGELEAISSLSHQPHREAQFFFPDNPREFTETDPQPSNSLWIAEYVFFLPRRNAAGFHFESYSQIKSNQFRVGLIQSYSYHPAFLEAALPARTFPSAHEALKALDRGEVDLVTMERTVGRWILHQLDAADSLVDDETVLFRKPYHLAFTRTSTHPQVEEAFRLFHREWLKMRESGEYESIVERYLKPDYLSRISRPLEFVCEEWPPYEYRNGDRIAGIDAAVVDRIMTRLGIPYRISIYPWSRAWMLAEKGKADAILSVSYQPAREPILFYTEAQRNFEHTGQLPPDYLWLTEYVFFVMKRSSDRFPFESYAQLKAAGARIGRNRDYTYDPAFLAAGFQGPLFSSIEEGFKALVAGQIDLYPMDKTVGLAALRRMGIVDSVAWLPRPLFQKPYLSPFCRRSDFPDLERIMRAFYRELRLMRADGEYDRLRDAALRTEPLPPPPPP